MSEIECFSIFFLFAVVGYSLRRRHRCPIDWIGTETRVPSSLSNWSPSDFHGDPASRLLLGLGDAKNEKSDSPAVCNDVLKRRREEIVFAYATGHLIPEMRPAFNQRILDNPGIAASIEAYRALDAFVTKEQRGLRIRRSYRRSTLSSLWARCTLPSSQNLAVSIDGPCLLMNSPDTPMEVEGTIVFVSGYVLRLNLGEESGLTGGDILEIERARTEEWIGCAVIQNIEGLMMSTAIFMGEDLPHIGDRVKSAISSDSLWGGLPE